MESFILRIFFTSIYLSIFPGFNSFQYLQNGLDESYPINYGNSGSYDSIKLLNTNK